LVSEDANAAVESALRHVRVRRGLKVSRAIALFVESLERQGETAPTRDSLKRMFAYWESGVRPVTRDAYQRAFCEIYEAPPDALGFGATSTPDDADGLSGEVTAIQSFRLYQVDQELVDLFELQTQNLRMLDRRLGADAVAIQARAHVDQVAQTLRRSVAGPRGLLSGCLAEAAALVGWHALDRWDQHDLARSAARESGTLAILAHVSGQQSCVLLDSGQPDLAVKLAAKAAHAARGRVPKLLSAWLAATEAEARAAVGDATTALRKLEYADRLLGQADGEQLPYLMLTAEHLARWRGHCIARLGHPEAIEFLTTALAGAGDSVRAATGLHTDLALAYHQAGQLDVGRIHASTARDMAQQFGSVRQRRRLGKLLAATDR
jgi:hypothetical protein